MKYLLPSGLAVAAIALSFASCIRDEALNAECDITGVDSAWVAGIRQQGIIKGEPIVTNESVRFIKRRGDVDCSALAPLFTLTPGATIEPANGSVRDFTTPQTYTVTAEDGNWRKVYTVEFGVLEASSKYGFDHAKLDASRQYQEFYELQGNLAKPDTARIWASGNGGYAFTGMAKSPGEYPTTISPDGRTGSCARLETMDTGSFGAGLNMHIAAGNLFIGEFRTASAVLYPRRATRFGLQLVGSRPVSLRGYYKYKAGETFTDELGQVRPEMHDTCDIYAVLYEVDPDNFEALNGDDVLSSERIVSLARIDNPGEPQEWTYFDEPFKPCNGKAFDYARLETDGYAIAIVLTSSRQGAYFRGSIGSVLYVDDLELVYEAD